MRGRRDADVRAVVGETPVGGEAAAATTEAATGPPRADGVLGNAVSLASGEIGARAVAFVATAYLSRRLGPAGFGVVGFASALISYFALAVNAGITRGGARAVAAAPDRAPTLALGTTLLRLGMAAVAFVGVAAIAWALRKPDAVRLVVLFSGLTLFAQAADTSWVHTGLGRGRRVAAALVAGQVLYVAALAALVTGPADVARVPVAQFLGELGASLILFVPLLREGPLHLDLRAAADVLRASLLPMLTRFLRALIFTFDVLLLGLLVSAADVGLYTAAYRLCFLLLAIAVSIQAAYLPLLGRAARERPEAVRDVARRVLAMSAAVGTPLVVGGILVAEPLMRAVFGPEYGGGAAVLRVLLLSIGCVFAYGVATSVLLAVDRLRMEVAAMAAGAAVNVALNLAVIPAYGTLGAAVVTALSEVVILVLCWRAAARAGVAIDARPAWRPLAAGGVMAAVLTLAGDGAGLPVSLALGGASYVVALVALRGLPEEARPHVHALRAAVTRQVGGGARR